jgi:AraC-like DNA-binding protein/NAD(P)H-dependent FMN reductase
MVSTRRNVESGTARITVISDDLSCSSHMAQLISALESAIRSSGGTCVTWAPSYPLLPAGLGSPSTGTYERLREAVRVSQSVVLLTSVHNNSYSSALKLTLDSLDDRHIRRKAVGLVSLDSGRSTYAIDQLRIVLAAMGAVTVPRSLVVSHDDFWPEEEHSISPSGSLRDRVDQFVDELSWFTGKLRPSTDREDRGDRGGGAAAADGSGRAQEPTRGESSLSPRIGSAVAYIRENFADNGLTLDLAADAAHLSRYHFSRTFKKETGHRYIDFVTDLRIGEARALLARTDLSVAEVSRRVGYQDPGHFQRTFKVSVRMSPSDFRSVHSGSRDTVSANGVQ